MEKLTDVELKSQLRYDPLTGDFRWLVSNSNRVKIGDVAGSKNSDGYIRIAVNNKKYLAHRLAWLYINGYFPENSIDHIDRVKHHNWILNLREASQTCNMRNRKTNINNTSGVAGIHWSKSRKKWCGQITVNRKILHLGYFIDIQDAVKARWEAEVKYEFPNCNTISSAYLHLKKRGLCNE